VIKIILKRVVTAVPTPAFLPAVVVVPSPVDDAAPTNLDIIFYEVG